MNSQSDVNKDIDFIVRLYEHGPPQDIEVDAG